MCYACDLYLLMAPTFVSTARHQATVGGMYIDEEVGGTYVVSNVHTSNLQGPVLSVMDIGGVVCQYISTR